MRGEVTCLLPDQQLPLTGPLEVSLPLTRPFGPPSPRKRGEGEFGARRRFSPSERGEGGPKDRMRGIKGTPGIKCIWGIKGTRGIKGTWGIKRIEGNRNAGASALTEESNRSPVHPSQTGCAVFAALRPGRDRPMFGSTTVHQKQPPGAIACPSSPEMIPCPAMPARRT
jgi:hypothetical protein